MRYALCQSGRASIDFLVDLRHRSDRLETISDRFAERAGLDESTLPKDIDALQQRITPTMQSCRAFRILHLMREWQLNQHGPIAVGAFEEIRAEIEPELRALQRGPTEVAYASELEAPRYWDGYEFHRTAGGPDGHDYMGFIHGELIHRKMIGETFAGAIYAQRKQVAGMAPVRRPAKILELGCASGQFTQALAEVYPHSEIWACDLSARQLEQAQRRANESGLRWHLLEAAAEDTGLEDDTFDLVASYAVFHELPTAASKALLLESFRLLKPGGWTIVGDVKAYHAQNKYSKWKADFWNQLHGGDPFWRDYATTDLARIATEAGFSEAVWNGVEPDQYPFVLLARKPDPDRSGDEAR